jgi:hypothetical protein
MRPSGTRSSWLDRLAGGAALLAVTSCYGLVLLAGALSFFGMTLSVHDGAWAAIVTFFALLALAGVLLGYKRHRSPGPALLALVGAGLITGVSLAHYNWMAELAGFAALAAAATWDWRLRRPPRFGSVTLRRSSCRNQPVSRSAASTSTSGTRS